MAKTIQAINLDYENVRVHMKQYFRGMTRDQLAGISTDIDEAIKEKGFSITLNEDQILTSTKLYKSTRQKIVCEARNEVEEVENRTVWVTSSGGLVTGKTTFVVNREKRTVVALIKNIWTGGVIKRGIAKCLPEDCFNVHIGKAIAYYRLLGCAVPEEFLNAPAPEGKEIGDVVRYWNRFMNRYKNRTLVPSNELINEYTAHINSPASKMGRVIDDSNRKY